MAPVILHEYHHEGNTPVPQSHVTGEHASALLGPLHVPRSVLVGLDADGRCVFQFEYVNAEPPEHRSRVLSDPRIHVRLAKHTKKILEVSFAEPEVFLRRGGFSFDASESMSWCADLEVDRQFVSSRNAEVVASIIAELPQEIRTQLSRDVVNASEARVEGG